MTFFETLYREKNLPIGKKPKEQEPFREHRYRLLYCTLIPGMRLANVKVCKITNFNWVPENGVSNHIAKTGSKSVQPFGWNFVHKQTDTHTGRQTNKQTNKQTD